MARVRPLSPKGFPDRIGTEVTQRLGLTAALLDLWTAQGFCPLDTPALERVDALGAFLPDTDRPRGGVFALETPDDGWLALRYDLTAPLARFVAANRATLPTPFKRATIGTVWRDDKPGAGRLRQFVQADVDVVGSSSPEADAQVIDAVWEGLARLGLAPYCSIRVSDRRLLDAAFDAAGLFEADARVEAARALDAVGKIGADGVAARLGAGRTDASGAFTPGLGLPTSVIDALLAFLALPATDDVQAWADSALALLPSSGQAVAAVQRVLGLCSVPQGRLILDPSIVRGMSYYTGMVFEISLDAEVFDAKGRPVSIGALGGGGRYDGLLRRFTGQDIPSVGGSIGFDRALLARSLLGIDPPPSPSLVIVARLPGAPEEAAGQVARLLRAQGFAAEVALPTGGLGAQLRYADQRAAPLAVIVGGDEWALGQVMVKDLILGRTLATATSREGWLARPAQQTVALDALATTVAALMDQPQEAP